LAFSTFLLVLYFFLIHSFWKYGSLSIG
jgi:hypothetical protein